MDASDINLTWAGILTPINHMDLYHKICYYVPINVTFPLVFTLLYTLIMDLGIPKKVFGDFEDARDKSFRAWFLRWAFTEEKYREKLIMVNFLYLFGIMFLPGVLT
jgi:hypothetical protein